MTISELIDDLLAFELTDLVNNIEFDVISKTEATGLRFLKLEGVKNYAFRLSDKPQNMAGNDRVAAAGKLWDQGAFHCPLEKKIVA